MRIIGGAWRGRRLEAPLGEATRPTSDRARQAVFDRLMHAPWATLGTGRAAMEGVAVLDAFAGTGAMGLEALSRGAGSAVFLETDRAALAVLRANVAACGAEGRCRVLGADVRRPPPGPAGGACGLVFLDPPYGRGLVAGALKGLGAAGWIAAEALVVVETGLEEPGFDEAGLGDGLAEFTVSSSRFGVWRWAG